MIAEPKTEQHDPEAGFSCYWLKPHFLFNALALASALASQNPRKAKDVLLDISDLIRAAIGCGESDQHSLEDELALAKCYAAINTERYAGRLQVKFRIDSGLAASVPVFSLVSLLEAAIPEALKAGGLADLLVSAAAEGPQARLSVHFGDQGIPAQKSMCIDRSGNDEYPPEET